MSAADAERLIPHTSYPGFARCQYSQLLSREAIHRPLVHRLGAEGVVEIDGRLIPIQDCPLQTAAAALPGDVRETGQQSLAVALSPRLRLHEEVFEVDARLA